LKALLDVKPSPEQLALFSRVRPGVEVIRGAAGSGKTSTALLKLRSSVGFYISRMKRQAKPRPISVLVLTFNRTLRGYIAELAESQLQESNQVLFEISTFSAWAAALLKNPEIIDTPNAHQQIKLLGAHLKIDPDYLCDEVDYILGKYQPAKLGEYVTGRRDGRGRAHRVDRTLRDAIVREVIGPYISYKQKKKVMDWSDLATTLVDQKISSYDVVVVDETQDFSANEIRAVINQLSAEHTVTFVLDTTQRIYTRSAFTWSELGLVVRPENSATLDINYRNTRQIARFAAGILDGLPPDSDGALPNYQSALRDGEKPTVIVGRYKNQLKYVVQFIKKSVDLEKESVAFLHPRGGGWFDHTQDILKRNNLLYVMIARNRDWPQGDENIALSTFHSAKGLEFDYVVMIGMSNEVMPIDDQETAEDGTNESLKQARRITAMAVGRAKKQVILGFSPTTAPSVTDYFVADTYTKIDV